MRRCRKRPGIGRTQGSPLAEAAKQNSNKNTPTGHFSCCFVVNLVQSNWNDLVSDMYRIKGIITVLYPTNYIPGLTRTNTCNLKH